MAPISLGFDVSTIATPRLTGIGNYIKYLALAFRQLPEISLTGTYRLSRWNKIDQIKKFIPGVTLEPFLPLLSEFSRKDVFHGPDFRIAPYKFAKKVVTVHDLGYERLEFNSERARDFGKARMDNLILKSRPDFVVTDSDFTRNEFLERYPDYADRSRTVLLGSDHAVRPEETTSRFNFPYILFVGSLARNKNLENVIKAFELIKSSSSDLHLVVAGNRTGVSWSDYLIAMMNESVYRSQIHYLGYVDDENLPELYAHAFCFAFPSFFEGFGIPLLEAMRYGCPVVTSNYGAMKEITGDAAAQVDPASPPDISSAIASLTNEDVRTALIQKGYLHAAQYTWRKCAMDNVTVYKELLR